LSQNAYKKFPQSRLDIYLKSKDSIYQKRIEKQNWKIFRSLWKREKKKKQGSTK
ncbi:3446_t:CDS:1, partial [Gigaspora margarita]